MFSSHSGSHVILSLRGITLYNNSHVNVNDIGGDTDREALLCHTENIDCCTGVRALGEWLYPNGSAVNSVAEIDSNHELNRSNINQFLASWSQSSLRLFHVGVPTERGCFCCVIPDGLGLDQTMCVNLGKT